MSNQHSNHFGNSASEFWIKAWEQASEKNERTSNDMEEEKYWMENASVYDDRNSLCSFY